LEGGDGDDVGGFIVRDERFGLVGVGCGGGGGGSSRSLWRVEEVGHREEVENGELSSNRKTLAPGMVWARLILSHYFTYACSSCPYSRTYAWLVLVISRTSTATGFDGLLI